MNLIYGSLGLEVHKCDSKVPRSESSTAAGATTWVGRMRYTKACCR